MSIHIKEPERIVNRSKVVKTASIFILTLFFILIFSGVGFAENVPLNTTHNGTVSGDLYVNATQPVPFTDQPTSATMREFNQTYNLPTNTGIQWAEVYVNIYSGSGSANWPSNATILLDGDGDGVYETILGNELLTSDEYSADGTAYWINDHCFRVYSDYQLWYDVTGLISCTNPSVYVKTEQVGTESYDGRLKMITLIAAYNDGDGDVVDYWVNDGQDWINTGTSQTTFATSTVTANVDNATLNTVALSSKDGSYTFNGQEFSGTDPVAPVNYFEAHTWDVTSNVTPGTDSTMVYALRTGSSFKNVLATLAVREGLPAAPVANFTATPTGGTAPLTVQFSSTSQGLIDSYQWDFDNNGSTDSTDLNPIWTYQSRGSYTVKLSVTGPGGTNTSTKTNFVNVTGAKIWDVYPTDPQGSVKSILSSAVSGDVVYFHMGTYNFSKPSPLYGCDHDLKGGIIYRGEGKDVTFLNVDQQVYLQNSNICLEGFTITLTQALYVDAVGALIEDCIVICPTTSNRIWVDSGFSAVFESDTFINGTGICDLQINNGGTALISNCTFYNNINSCGTLFLKGGGTIIKNNIFNSNSNALYFYNIAGVNTFYLNTFTNNTKTINYIGTAVTQNFNSPTPILYTYNGTTYYNYMGNYWPNYTGRDDNHDGIGDTPYTAHNGFGVDNYPLIAPISQYDLNAVQANFTVTSVSGIVPLTVQFTDISLGTVTDYVWDFNDDGFVDSNEKNPTWTYNQPGIYTVKLTVSNSSDSDDEIKTDYITVIPDTEAPTVTANPTSGTSNSLIQVILSAVDNSGYEPDIYFTTDGSEPTRSSILYTVPINVPMTTVLKFIAVDLFGNVSTVRSETYTINDTEAPTVTANPAGGTYTSKTDVILTATDNVDPNPAIYYTMDGSTPTTNSTRYTDPFYIPANFINTLKFFAADATGNTSPVQTETYTMIPDLELSGMSVTNYPISKNKVSGTVNNSDAADVGAFNVTVQIGGNSTTVNIPGLAAGGSTTFTVLDSVKHQVGETIAVNVMVDLENVISEADETNNSYSSNVIVATTGDNYLGGRFSRGVDLVNNMVFAEGNVGVRILKYGDYRWLDRSNIATYTASALNIPEGATLISARLYQAWTWYGYPNYTIQVNGHETQHEVALYTDCIAGQYVFDVTDYLKLYEDNTVYITSGAANYGTILVVVYEAASEPYRQIWVNEGADCIFSGSGDINGAGVAWTTFDNVSTANLASAQVTTVLLSGSEDGYPVYFNGQTIPLSGEIVGDPGIHFHDVTSALENGTCELGVPNTLSYFDFAIGVLEVTQQTATAPGANFISDVTTGDTPLTVQFTDTSTSNPTSWTWEYNLGSGWITFASGTDSAAQNPLYTFTTPGTYDIRLTVANSVGSDMETGYIIVNPLRVTNTRSGLTYYNIQDAIDDILTLDGDTLTVMEDTYNENITISKQLILDTTGNVTVQPVNVDLPVFTINTAGSGASIIGFTITGATNSCGVSLESADNCNIAGNVISGNSVGVKLYNSNSNTIAGNTVENNGWAGIVLDNATGNTINNSNTVTGNQEGVFLANNSQCNTITGNNIHDNRGIGINILSNSIGNVIQNNAASFNGVMGVFVQNSNTNNITGNNITNNGWAGICLDNASGNTISNGNEVAGNQDGIFMANASTGNTIEGNNIHNNNGIGISILGGSDGNSIAANSAISYNGVMGVFVQNSSNNILSGNDVQGNTVQYNGWAGVCLDNSDSNTITNSNIITNNQEGIFIANSSDKNTIGYNAGPNGINNNTYTGISILNSNNNEIINNNINNNGTMGIFIQNSDGNEIYNGNTITGSGWGGIILDTTTNTTVYQNNLNNNYEQALAVNGSGNTFYQNTIGNYYSDWTTTNTRPIDGNENIYDQYPSTMPF